VARPSTYSAEIALTICQRIVDGESLRSICKDEAMPSNGAVYKWLAEGHPEFVEQYARAREVYAHLNFDETREIVDNDPDPVRARLRFDQRRWAAGKLLPKVYGERLEIDATVRPGVVLAEPLSEDEWNREYADRRLAPPAGTTTRSN
jgi:hypothetical protein